MQYDHTQRAPMYLILIVIAAVMLTTAWSIPEVWVRVLLVGVGAFMLLLAMCFRHLNVSDEGDRLRISFGPLPLFHRSVAYDEIDSVERTRSTLLDGWGIHLSPSGGWTWNLWGFDCVDVRYRQGRKVRIGTDDPAGLEAFLQGQMRREGGTETRT